MKLMAVGLSALMLIGCGSTKEQSVTLTNESSGVKVDMLLEAKGDTLQKMTQTSTLDISAYGEEYVDLFQEQIDLAEEKFEGITGATYSYDYGDTELKEIITIDMTDTDSLDKLSNENLLPIEGTTSKVSLEKTKESLVGQGWTVVEE